MQDIDKRESISFFIVFVLSIIGLGFALWWNYTHPRMIIKYDCSISEISPDYPIEVKEGCRKLRANRT